MKYFLLGFLIIISCKNENEIKIEKRNENQLKTVGIQPYENFSVNDAKLIAYVIDSFYGFKTKVLPNKQLMKRAFINTKSPRYRADSIIKFQKEELSKNLDYIVGLTNQDISVTKKDENGAIKKPLWKYADFGIMGLAYCPGKSAIISQFRFRNSNKKIELTRLRKVVIHEFGHNLGLPHCPNNFCVMTSANEKLSNIDNEKLALCNNCKNLINY